MVIGAIAINTFREAIRNKILYSVVLFAVVLVAVSAIFGSVTIGDTVKVIKDFGLFALSFCGAIITIISGVTLLNKELKQKTVYNILSKPVRRWQFILGKHLGLTLTVWCLVALMGAGLLVFTSMMEGRIDYLLLQGIFFVLLEVTVVAAVAIFFSALVVTTTLSGLFTFAFYVAGRSIPHLSYFLTQAEETPPIVTTLVKVFDFVLPDLSLFNFADSLVYGFRVPLTDIARATGYCLSYTFIALALATLIFNRRELT